MIIDLYTGSDLIQTVVKMVIGFFGMLVYINTSGISTKTTLTTTDQVQNLVLGGIIGGVLYNGVGILQFVFVLFSWSVLIYFQHKLKAYSQETEKLLDGRIIPIISDGNLLLENLENSQLLARELGTLLRTSGIKSIEDIRWAQIEANGHLTIIRKNERSFGVYVIADGEIDKEALEDIDLDREWVLSEIKRQGYESVSEIYLGEYFKTHLNIYPYDIKELKNKKIHL